MDDSARGTPSARAGHATLLLSQLAAGRVDARDELMALLYSELREQAAFQMSRERSGHTLQATALVHEAWVRLERQGSVSPASRSEFLGLAALAMKRILVEHARTRMREKRGGSWERVELPSELALPYDGDTDEFAAGVIELAEALERLHEESERMARIVELRFFGGLTREEVAETLGVSRATVQREWRVARAWLAKHVGGPDPDPPR